MADQKHILVIDDDGDDGRRCQRHPALSLLGKKPSRRRGGSSGSRSQRPANRIGKVESGFIHGPAAAAVLIAFD
jgi:hypothetical protein